MWGNLISTKRSLIPVLFRYNFVSFLMDFNKKKILKYLILYFRYQEGHLEEFMEIRAKTRTRTSKMRKRDFMGQHYLQHGRAEGRVEVKNNTRGSTRAWTWPCWTSRDVSVQHGPEHARVRGRVEHKNVTRDHSTEKAFNTGSNTAVLKPVLKNPTFQTINSVQTPKEEMPSFDKNTEKSHSIEERERKS